MDSVEKSETDLDILSSNEGEFTSIDLSIHCIENIIRDDNFQIKITLEHVELILGESELVDIESNQSNCTKVHPIDLTVSLQFTPRDIAFAVDAPILIKIFEITNDDGASSQNLEMDKNKKSTRKKRASKDNTTKLLGLCNVDLLPIILGEKELTEKLVVEIPSYTWASDAVAWKKLPMISVTIKKTNSDFNLKDSDYNILNITVESIYNTPMAFTENMQYKCGTVLYTDHDETKSYIIFDTGKWTNFHDVEKMKTWISLQHLESRARFSKYKINPDYETVKNEFKGQFDLQKTVKENVERIEWNTMHRTMLFSDTLKCIQDRIKKYKNWPFEIMVTPNEQNNVKAKKKIETLVYQCYLDISSLLFPGRTKARALAQLYTHSLSEMESKTGLQLNIFSNDEEPKKGKRKSRISKDISLTSRLTSEEEACIPLTDDNGRPVLILIEFELLKPLIRARTFDEFTNVLENLKNLPRPIGPVYCYSPDLVLEQYINSIKVLVDVINNNYRDFLEQYQCQGNEDLLRVKKPLKKKNTCEESNNPEGNACPYFYIQDELSRFKQYLHETGNYITIRTVLKNKIINLIDHKFTMDSPDRYSIENQNFVATCYTYLVEQMHVALNTKLDVRFGEESPNFEHPRELWFLTEEAYEFEEYEKTDKLITKIVTENKKNPDSWILYAIYFIRNAEIDEALECCREAIRLCTRHKIALIFYGVLLATKEDYSNAEIFLKAVTYFYPRFAEGWAILHLLYIKTQYYPGIDITFEIAEKCVKDRIRDCNTMDILKEEPIAWSTLLCRPNRVYLLTAVLLLKLHLYCFAGIALSQDLCQNDKTFEYLYFMSVNYYLQWDYAVALEYSTEAESIIGLEHSIASLLGHLHYKSQQMEKAIEYYESVDMLYERPDDIHLVHLRMGYHYIDKNDFLRARSVFLRSCKYSPSCKTWLGVGMASYHLENYEDCEFALMKANQIDCENAQVWAYFCLLNMALGRYDEFTQCYRQMVKNDLRSDKLWRLITHSMETLGYSTPIIQFEDKNKKCSC